MANYPKLAFTLEGTITKVTGSWVSLKVFNTTFGFKAPEGAKIKEGIRVRAEGTISDYNGVYLKCAVLRKPVGERDKNTVVSDLLSLSDLGLSVSTVSGVRVLSPLYGVRVMDCDGKFVVDGSLAYDHGSLCVQLRTLTGDSDGESEGESDDIPF